MQSHQISLWAKLGDYKFQLWG